MKRLILGLAGFLGLLSAQAAEPAKLKAGFIYTGPVASPGWDHSHEEARLKTMKALPWLESSFVESVPEGEEGNYIDLMVKQGARVIFTTAYGFGDGTVAAAKRYPKIIFAHASGYTRAPNLATYLMDAYQISYLNGLMAGALTQSGVVGYVSCYPQPELKRHINAFAVGVRETNPKAKVVVRWLNAWYNPSAAREAAESLIADKADVLISSEGSPTVVQVAAQHGLPSFSQDPSMSALAPSSVVSGTVPQYENFYIDFLTKVHDGIYTPTNLQNVDFWGLLSDKAIALGTRPGVPINPLFLDKLNAAKVPGPVNESVYDRVIHRLAQMSAAKPSFDPFLGPFRDRKNQEQVPAGKWLVGGQLATIEWAAPGVVGPWQNEP
jgi:simple sugar transport system substrate-binding protein